VSLISTELARVLEHVRRPGDFCAGGACEMFAPGLEVEGVGPIALPLLPAQAERLIAVAKRAPFGRGERTLVDTDVRRTWQINPDQVHIHGQGWARTLAEIVERVADGLGVTEPIAAEFYKLLVYDEGSFFVGHRDTEKAPGMFATLVVVLPSISTGGELSVRHRDREIRFDMQASDPSRAAFAAFYADCVHEVLPVTSGCRLTLVYNLLRRTPGEAPRPPGYEAEGARMAALLRQWESDDDAPTKLIHPLEHAYTLTSLSFTALKGADAAKAAALVAAAQDAACELHLALLSIEESGSAEHTGGYGSYRRGRCDEEEGDEFELIEVHDRRETLSEWRRPDGADAGMGILPFDEEEVAPPDALDDMAPDDESFREATGNEGASFERSYRKAALVLWPRRNRIAVLNQGGLRATLPYLADLAERWVASGEGRASALWAQAHELSGHMLVTWPMDRWRLARSPEDVTTMLTNLGRLGDTARVESFLADVTAAATYTKGQADSILSAMRLLSPSRVITLFEAIVAGNAGVGFADSADLLARAAAGAASGGPDLRPTDLLPAARALLAAMPGDPARRSEETSWSRVRAVEPQVVVDIMATLERIDSRSADAAADVILAWPETYGLDAVVVPAILKLGPAAAAGSAAITRLRDACLAHLRTRIDTPLAPPANWTRASAVTCSCSRCGELSRFLGDPSHPTWSYRAVQADRSHVESTILQSKSDLDCKTLRKGSPHTLLCTKNQASYERRARQREKDLADLTAIEP
jgi:predicted 2-oxoglutarate/Fe(II)-dependent dioxygenase YbiX